MANIRKYMLLPFMSFIFLTPSHADDVIGTGRSNIEPPESVGERHSSEVVSQKLYLELLKKKAEQDIEIQKMRKELSDKDELLNDQKKRITTLKLENKEMQSKYDHDINAAVKENQEELSEEYGKREENKKDKRDVLRVRCRPSQTSDKQTSMEVLYHQLEQSLQEEIERGEVRLEFRRANQIDK